MGVDMMTEWANLISSVGFPIGMCLLMWYQNSELTKTHKEETDELKKAIENNTLILTELTALIKNTGDK